MKILRSLLAVFAVTLIATHTSFASVAVPEIDLAIGTGALALLGGAVMFIRSRNKA